MKNLKDDHTFTWLCRHCPHRWPFKRLSLGPQGFAKRLSFGINDKELNGPRNKVSPKINDDPWEPGSKGKGKVQDFHLTSRGEVGREVLPKARKNPG